MRFTITRNASSVVADLVRSLDRDGRPIAETCRRVGDAAAARGIVRPSYPHVRRLVLAERRRRSELRELRSDVLAAMAAGRAVDPVEVVERLREASSARPVEPCVSETQGGV